MPDVLAAINPRLDPMTISPDGKWVAFEIDRWEATTANYGRGDEPEHVLYVKGHEKGIRLNVTNTKRLVKALTPMLGAQLARNSDNWPRFECYAKGTYVNTPSGDETFSWRFDDGSHAMAIARERMSEERRQSELAQQLATSQNEVAQQQLATPAREGLDDREVFDDGVVEVLPGDDVDKAWEQEEKANDPPPSWPSLDQDQRDNVAQ